MSIRELVVLDPRIPAWDATTLQARHCPVCERGGTLPLYRRPDGLHVHRCESCALYFVANAPTDEALTAFYAAYDAAHSRNELSFEAQKRLLDAMAPDQDPRIRRLSTLMDMSGARVLDVGFGRAGFLYLLGRLGASLHGVDPDSGAHEWARRLGIHGTVRGDVDAIDADARFDLITLNDLLEHPRDPLTLLRACVARIRPGGLLSVWTPNGGHIDQDDSAVMLRVDLEHLQYFSRTTCERIAERLGLEIACIETSGQPDLAAYRGAARGGRGVAGRALRALRRGLRAVPGLDGMRGPVAGSDAASGNYSLFCVFRIP